MQEQYTTPHYKSKKFSSKLCEKLFSFTENGQYSDVCLVSSDNIKLFAHACILTASSDFFMKLLDDNIMDFSSIRVEIADVTGEVLKPVLKFLYTGRVDLRTDTVEHIVDAAMYLQIQPLIDECFDFMSSQFREFNCIGVIKFADRDGFNDLFDRAARFASIHFDEITRDDDEEYLTLKENQLSAIISSDSLRVSSEEKVFSSVLKWMEHDQHNRTNSAYNLFSKIRYWLLTPNFIREQRSKLPSQINFLEMVCSWLEWHSLPGGQRPEKPMKYFKHIDLGLLLVGGGAIQTYDADLKLWNRADVPEIPSRFDKVVSYKDKLIFASLEKPLIFFDQTTKEVTRLPKMNVPRRNYAMIVLWDKLYVFGGQKDSSYSPWIPDVEKYTLSDGKWTTLAPMNKILTSPKVEAAHGYVYLVGDRSATMECYNIPENKWSSQVMVDPQKSAFAFAQLRGEMYKIGGVQCRRTKHGKNTFSKSLYIYNTQKETWTQKADMEIALTGQHCVRWNNRLIMCGGRDEKGTYFNVVQEYNRDLNQWKALAPMVEYKESTDYGLVTVDPSMT